MDQPLAEETPLNTLLHHTATPSLGRLKEPIIQDNDAYRMPRWAYDVILGQASGSISPTGGLKPPTARLRRSIVAVQ